MTAVEPLYNGHPGAELTGRCREVAIAGRFQEDLTSEKYGEGRVTVKSTGIW